MQHNSLNNRDFNIDQYNRDYDFPHNRAALTQHAPDAVIFSSGSGRSPQAGAALADMAEPWCGAFSRPGAVYSSSMTHLSWDIGVVSLLWWNLTQLETAAVNAYEFTRDVATPAVWSMGWMLYKSRNNNWRTPETRHLHVMLLRVHQGVHLAFETFPDVIATSRHFSPSIPIRSFKPR